jgi:amidohydrolase
MATPLVAEASEFLDDAIALRRELHRKPELGLDLPNTQQLILESIDGLGLDVYEGEHVTSVVGVLDGDLPGPTTLLRADMDALPLNEDTGLEYSSRIDGVMHACGHDAHVAMLVGAARLLNRHRAELAGRVVFMFQPGEEGYAGARHMLEEGLIERHGPFDRAHALHITPLVPSGFVCTKSGTVMASADAFEVTVTGRGGHASRPEDAVDPIPVACELVGALQSMITRRVPVFDPGVLTVASITAGTTNNVIPETAVIMGTIRAVSDQTRTIVLDGLNRVAEHVAAAHRCTASVEQVAVPYPVTVNAEEGAERVLEVATSVLGDDHVFRMPAPLMGAEDWSFVLNKVPGAMAFLGAQPPGTGPVAGNHSNRMLIEENAMTAGIAVHAGLVLGS